MQYQTIRLDKAMYKASGGFNHQLELLDPSAHYKGSELETLDAYQRQLKRFDIKVSGQYSDTIAKFFATSDSAALFPEFVARSVLGGVVEHNILEDIIASTSVINALDYRSVTTHVVDHGNPVVAEGAPLPETKIILSDMVVKLKKRGQLLSASYEAIKHQRADVIRVALSQIGIALNRTQMNDAIHTLAFGDTGTPAAEQTVVTKKAFDYSDLLALWGQFTSFELNTLLVSPATARQLLTLPELRESSGGDRFITDGTLITPFGAKLIPSPAVDDEVVIGLDKRFALEMVTTGGIQVEYDKLIDTQLERAAITTTYGFSKLFPDAVHLLIRE